MLLTVVTATIQSIILLLFRYPNFNPSLYFMRLTSRLNYLTLHFLYCSILLDSMLKLWRIFCIHSTMARYQRRNSTVSWCLLKVKKFPKSFNLRFSFIQIWIRTTIQKGYQCLKSGLNCPFWYDLEPWCLVQAQLVVQDELQTEFWSVWSKWCLQIDSGTAINLALIQEMI